MEYKQFTLDPFQVQSIESIENNNSVVVSAATGTGKTLIADYLIDKAIGEGKRIFYTAPIKALSNQKYRDFKEEYGEDKVGIMTGDVVINPEADVIVMTTEIYRNMLVVKDKAAENLSYVVFDEIHFINDIERGTVWEESIIFSDVETRFLCLSATIPNAQEFADWIMKIKGHQVDVVEYTKRAVPLAHYLYEKEAGITTALKFKKTMKDLDGIADYHRSFGKRKSKIKRELPAQHYDLIKEINKKNLKPLIFFVFSRRMVEEKAKELFKMMDFLNQEEKAKIASIYSQKITPEVKPLESAQMLRKLIGKGIGIHHAGMLPLLKEIVELLFAEGLIKVLYATETFAVGINMPAKCVCFNTLEKYDGINFRYLNSKEYYQMAGRAGRRGIDKEGTSIVLIDKNQLDIDKIIQVTQKDCDPIISQFKLSINTVINLVNSYDNEKIEQILKSNFDYYLQMKKNKNVRIMLSYSKKIKQLQRLGYIDKDMILTEKGRFSRHIYAYEILITEIFCSEMPKKLSDEDLLIIIGTICYEGRRGDRFARRNVNNKWSKIINLLSENIYIEKNLNRNAMRNLIPMISTWYNGGDFDELLELSNLKEGDIVRLFRQMIDYIRQIKKATDDYPLKERLEKIKEKIDRDLIAVEF